MARRSFLGTNDWNDEIAELTENFAPKVGSYFTLESGDGDMGDARSAELIPAMRTKQLEPKRIRFVHQRIAAPASVMLIEARVDGGIEVTIEPPLILYERPGIYTAEARALLSSPD